MSVFILKLYRIFKFKINVKRFGLIALILTGLQARALDSSLDLAAWKKSMAARTVSVVYASPYLGNPASMFGHTFLKISSGRTALLDLGVSFDALPAHDSAIIYAWKGLAGGYKGMFSEQAYFEKINTYSHLEDRDLWEYELNLTNEQIDHLLDAIWNSADTKFDYYFSNKNCSYQLLALLDAANPSWHLQKKFNAMTIPLDTIRALRKISGAIHSVKFRPSLFKTLQNRYDQMNDSEKRDFKKLQINASDLSGAETVNVLDAALDWQKHAGQKVNSDLLVARSDQNTSPHLTSVKTLDEKLILPEDGHKSRKLSIGAISENGMQAFSFEFRPVLHDALDPDLGYIPFSSLKILETDFIYHKNIFALDRLVIAEVTNLSPMTQIRHGPSWLASANVYRPRDINCLNCLAGQLQFGLGASRNFINENFLIYTFAKAQSEFSDSFKKEYFENYRLGPAIEIGLYAKLFANLKLHLSAENFWYAPAANQNLNEFSKLGSALSFAGLPFEIRAGVETWLMRNSNFTDLKLSLGWYY